MDAHPCNYRVSTYASAKSLAKQAVAVGARGVIAATHKIGFVVKFEATLEQETAILDSLDSIHEPFREKCRASADEKSAVVDRFLRWERFERIAHSLRRPPTQVLGMLDAAGLLDRVEPRLYGRPPELFDKLRIDRDQLFFDSYSSLIDGGVLVSPRDAPPTSYRYRSTS